MADLYSVADVQRAARAQTGRVHRLRVYRKLVRRIRARSAVLFRTAVVERLRVETLARAAKFAARPINVWRQRVPRKPVQITPASRTAGPWLMVAVERFPVELARRLISVAVAVWPTSVVRIIAVVIA